MDLAGVEPHAVNRASATLAGLLQNLATVLAWRLPAVGHTHASSQRFTGVRQNLAPTVRGELGANPCRHWAGPVALSPDSSLATHCTGPGAPLTRETSRPVPAHQASHCSSLGRMQCSAPMPSRYRPSCSCSRSPSLPAHQAGMGNSDSATPTANRLRRRFLSRTSTWTLGSTWVKACQLN